MVGIENTHWRRKLASHLGSQEANPVADISGTGHDVVLDPETSCVGVADPAADHELNLFRPDRRQSGSRTSTRL
jgi:hypothetical protein